MVPTLVTPPSTGATDAEAPLSVLPPSGVNEAFTWMLPRTVGTPGIEKVPLAAVVPVRPPVAVTVAPETGPLFWSVTSPVTKVSGSGSTLRTTFAALPMLFPKSWARAPNVSVVMPDGIVNVNW